MNQILQRADYTHSDPPGMARYFLGKTLCVRGRDGSLIRGLIYETEAYGGSEDAACHGYGNRKTARTSIMFSPGGYAYVYLCYGLHRLFNIVTGPGESPEAVLIRGVRIISGEEEVRKRRKGILEAQWSNGPGKVSQAMNIRLDHNGWDLTRGCTIWIEDEGIKVDFSKVVTTPRVGIDYAGAKWAQMPWRFVWLPEKGK